MERHGDGIKDVAFHVDDATGIFNKAVSRGAKAV
jgi:4-hydroxyphenylpyruvate dioxygenase-like putative hemolysin